MRGTILTYLDLRETEGLNRVEHLGASDVGVQTIYRSRGEIPLDFLRGAGVPESFIASIPALVDQAKDSGACLISFSAINQEFVERLAGDLRQHGVRCWLVSGGIETGPRALDRLARLHDKILLVLSRGSLAGSWMTAEVASILAWESEKRRAIAVPICRDPEVLAMDEDWLASLRGAHLGRDPDAYREGLKRWLADLRTAHAIGDFTGWKDPDAYQLALEQLLRALTTEEG
jgi:hypothetical protein